MSPRKGVFRGFYVRALKIELNNWDELTQTCVTSVILVRWILLSKKIKKDVSYQLIASTHEYDTIECTQINLTSLTTLKINCRTNQGISEGSETSVDECSPRQIRFCSDYFCLDPGFTWFKKWDVKNEFYKKSQSSFGFSLPRELQHWFQNCCSHFGFPGNYFFVGSYWMSNPAALCVNIN